MIQEQLEKIIEKELNNEELVAKFIALAKQKGWRYSNIRFADIDLTENKITIKVLTE